MLTYEEANKLLSYNRKTGVFKWKESRGGRKKNSIAGTKDKRGYIKIGINKKVYLAHRLVILIIFKRWPIYEVDHINGIKNDNCLCNLREVTHQENQKNCKLNKNNTSGVCGVLWHKLDKKWYACIIVNKKNIYLGSFKNKKDAIKARKLAEKEYDFHKNHGKK